LSGAAERARWRGGLLLWLAVALHGLGNADVVGDDEAREVGIVQAIVAGDRLLPRFNGELLPDKPILWHWLAAIPVAAGGFSEAAVRLPSALAAALTVAWTVRLGGGGSEGLAAAALLATMPAFFSRARVARPDALLVLLLSLALGLAFRWWRECRPRDARWALVALGAATLAKGPVAPVLFALAFGGFLAWQRDLRRLPAFVDRLGAAALIVLGAGWYVVALAGWGDVFVREHLLGRYVFNLIGDLPEGGRYSERPLAWHALFYVLHLPLVGLPWSPLAAAGLWLAWRENRLRDPRVRFLVCWMLAPVVAFTPAQYKLRYYLLPALPALALLGAPAVLRLWRATPVRGRGSAALAAGLAGAVVAAAAMTLGWRHDALARSDRGAVEALAFAVPGGVAGLATAAALAAGALTAALAVRAWRALLPAVALAMIGWCVVGAPLLERRTSRRDSLKAFAIAVGTRVRPGDALAFYAEPIRSVVVYGGRTIPTARRRGDIAPGMALIVREAAYRRLARAGVVGRPLVAPRGRTGNVARERVLLVRALDVRTPERAATARTPHRPREAQGGFQPTEG
jgi:4-amino-4-deoxy-L-arabinose transferase-like glycosyltransferase